MSCSKLTSFAYSSRARTQTHARTLMHAHSLSDTNNHLEFDIWCMDLVCVFVVIRDKFEIAKIFENNKRIAKRAVYI